MFIYLTYHSSVRLTINKWLTIIVIKECVSMCKSIHHRKMKYNNKIYHHWNVLIMIY